MARDFRYKYEGKVITYTVIDEETKTCKTAEGSYSSAGNKVEGDVMLPSNPMDGETEYTLTELGQYAFYNCTKLTSIVIPNSVTSIGASAFQNCSGMISVTIGNSVTSIGNWAFFGCSGLKKAEFASVESICNIDFNASSDNPLYYAHHLYIDGVEVTDIVIPDAVTAIGKYAFYNCSGLTSVVIPNSVQTIGSDAFNGCSGLTSVTIGNSVKTIGEDAFIGCEGLTKAEFASVESLCNIDFNSYRANPLYYAHHLYIDGEEVTDFVIPTSVTTIGNSAFCGCSGLTSIEIPNSVTSIGEDAFCLCSGLTSVEIPNSVQTIGNSAFSNCSRLTSVVIGNGVTYIGDAAFRYCSGLTSIEIPNSVTSIGDSSLKG
ncbi:MAG: leucine-rich repeat domain-containing protein, partial [Muribaculaceae bacterium]|nr:leucine-rich repeat domain-containing protein [Muribaculaceae bacterium]